jgi:hypothetical protein
MKKTGIFYHDVCGKEAYSSLAMGVEEGFQAIGKEGLFSLPNITWYESRQATEREIFYPQPGMDRPDKEDSMVEGRLFRRWMLLATEVAQGKLITPILPV